MEAALVDAFFEFECPGLNDGGLSPKGEGLGAALALKFEGNG